MVGWPIAMGRPLPDIHSAEFLVIGLAALLMSGFVAMLLVADQSAIGIDAEVRTFSSHPNRTIGQCARKRPDVPRKR